MAEIPAKLFERRRGRKTEGKVSAPAPTRDKTEAAKCQKCGSLRTQVYDSRSRKWVDGSPATKRLHCCSDCSERWATWQIRESQLSVLMEDHQKRTAQARVNAAAEMISGLNLSIDDLVTALIASSEKDQANG